MNSTNNTWDLSPVADGELFDQMMAELASDPEYIRDMDARDAEARDFQMVQDSLPF
jgi:hypothetical protein